MLCLASNHKSLESSKLGLLISGYALITISLLPLIRNDYWIFRVFEYPRLQKLIINSILLIIFLSLYPPKSTYDFIFATILSLNTIYLAWQVFPFTVIARKQLINTKKVVPERSISLFIGNIYQYNRNADKYLRYLQELNPDIIMVVETDNWWAKQLKPLKRSHPYTIEVPLENTYGMLLYSRLELKDTHVKFLVEQDIPSLHTKIKLPSGDLIQFHGLHPTPPVPGENPRSTERDKEILMVAKDAKASKIPVIVAGDLNDVAWSYTTELFSKISGLLDPRKGRGFFNTFHAGYPILRFPLDHVFCSVDFTLLGIKRLPTFGSDHFPMYIKLQFDPQAEKKQDEPELTEEALETAEEKLHAAT
jgi:endonuclease/exonuclease/phosphatase (EEP) superfamily protein YafD